MKEETTKKSKARGFKFQPSLTTWIFVSLFLGAILGIYFPDIAHAIKPFRTVFLNGVKCIIAPLIFSSIVTGINSSGSVKGLGKTGLRAIIWFEIATNQNRQKSFFVWFG